jgi:hypothetical protein
MRLLFALALLVLALLLVAFLLLVRPAWAATRCLTYEEKSLGRLQALCDDSTRAVSTYNRTLERWDTAITASPRQACTGQMDPRTRQVEVRCPCPPPTRPPSSPCGSKGSPRTHDPAPGHSPRHSGLTRPYVRP